MTRAMILAAGLGTRLGGLSDERPKPLLPVCDVPLVHYGLRLLRQHGICDVVVNLHHRGELIEAELGDGRALGVRILYSREAKILGTGGGLRRALPLLGDEPFVAMNGKVVIDLDLADVIGRHRDSGAAATLVVRADPDARRWGAVDAPLSGGRIRSLLADGAFMFTGVQVIDPALVARLPDDGRAHCIVREGYLPWLAAGVAIDAYVQTGYFAEHSTPERYLQGNFDLLPDLASVDPTAQVAPSAVLTPPVRIGSAAVVAAGASVGPHVVVGARSRVAPGVSLRRCVVWPDSVVATDAAFAIITPQQRVLVTAPLGSQVNT